MRENDQLQAKILISNEWDKPLADVVLRVTAPTFLSWSDTSCAEWKGATQGAANIGTVGANDFREVTVCLKSGSDVLVGDFNVSFTCEYSWPIGQARGRSFVTADKTVKSSLLGSDTVAGVPIALAAFIVPGLFFWLVLERFKVPWNVGSALGDKLVYSVVVSIILVWIMSWREQDRSGAIGLSRLIYFALVGGLVGAAIGGIDRVVRRLNQHQRDKQSVLAKAAEPKLGEDWQVLLGKLLHHNPYCRNPLAVVRLEDGTEYRGSLVWETTEVVAIIGWFRVVKENVSGGNRDQIIAALEQAARPIDLFSLAVQYKLEIEARNGIRETKLTGAEDEMGESLTIPIEGVTAQQNCNTGGDEVLILE
jgi:hypothetical protein